MEEKPNQPESKGRAWDLKRETVPPEKGMADGILQTRMSNIILTVKIFFLCRVMLYHLNN